MTLLRFIMTCVLFCHIAISHADPKLDLKTATLLQPHKKLAHFSLTSTDNKPFTESSFIGQWTLLFFGYGSCPEVCPKALMTFRDVFKLLPNPTSNIQPLKFVFVSLDPKTDKPGYLKSFLNRFNPDFIGLTGEEAVIEALSKSCSVYSWQDPEAVASAPKMIDHSATLLLINPQGRIQAVFTPPHAANAIAEDLKIILQ